MNRPDELPEPDEAGGVHVAVIEVREKFVGLEVDDGAILTAELPNPQQRFAVCYHRDGAGTHLAALCDTREDASKAFYRVLAQLQMERGGRTQ